MTSARLQVRAFLLGMVLSDVEILGLPESAVANRMFRVGHPDPSQSIFDRMIAHRSLRSLGPALVDVVGSVIEQAESSPLRLAAAVCDATYGGTSLAPPSYPLELLLTPGSVRPTTESHTKSSDLTDNHLHSGASIALIDLLTILVGGGHSLMDEFAPRPDERDDSIAERALRIWASDSAGTAFCLPVILGGIRTHINRILSKDWASGRTVSAAKFDKFSFWETVGRLARGFGGEPELLEELLAPFDERSYPDLAETLRSEIYRVQSSVVGERNELIGLLSALAIVNVVVTSLPGEGLGRFVDRFERMGIVKDLGAGGGRERLVASACRNIFSSDRVVGAEFRKTFISAGKEVAGLEDSIRQGLISHLVGVADFMKNDERRLRISMPVGFLREPTRPSRDVTRWSARYSLNSVGALATATRNACQTAGIERLVTGFDVAGNEAVMPNWPFLAAYQFLQDELGVSSSKGYSVHAGESFAWELQGVRHIGELLISPMRLSSVGHGLSLDRNIAAAVVGGHWFPPSNLEVVQDLAWLTHVGIEREESLDLLGRAIAASGLSTLEVSPVDFALGWSDLFSLDQLRSAGIVSTSGGLDFITYNNRWDVSRLSPRSRATWILSHTGPGDDQIRGSLGEALSEEFRQFQLRVTPLARQYVKEGLRARQVTIEACPTSNVRLSGVPNVRYTQIGSLVRAGLSVSISSDDPLIFQTNVTSEWRQIEDAFGSRMARRLARQSVASCSAPEAPLSARDLFKLAIELGWEPPANGRLFANQSQ